MKPTLKHRKSLSTDILNSKVDDESRILMPKSRWVPDKQAQTCFNCNKSFIPIVRPKHHCRRCGNIFCNS